MNDIVDCIEPAGARFLVKVDPEMVEMAGGIIAPEAHREAQTIGTVLKCGPDVPRDICAGRRIIFSKYSGTDFGIEGELGAGRQKVKMMSAIDVLGYIDAAA